MNALAERSSPSAAPLWLWGSAAVGVAWNLFGLSQFVGSFSETVDSLMAVEMSRQQAELYLDLPRWISAVFALGVLGGLAGSVALLLRHRWATYPFVVSLVGYILLFAGDAYYGVFEAIPAQLAVLALVVLVAVALLVLTLAARRRRLLH